MESTAIPREEEIVLGNPKLREAMLYVMRGAEDDPAFGIAKLSKMLFFADASHYRLHRTTITGQGYRRFPTGPAPDAVLDEVGHLKREGAAVEVEVASFDGRLTYRRLQAMREPNLALLSPEEQACLDQAIAELKPMTADEASEATHRMPIWRWAEDRAPLDFELVLSPVRVRSSASPEQRESALESARRQGLA